MTISYKIIEEENAGDVTIANEPFEIVGRLRVERTKNEWTHTNEWFTDKTEMTFPDEDYDIKDINEKGFAVGAYDGDKCIGLAILQDDWAKFMYLADLKVDRRYRNKGIAGELIRLGRLEAEKRKYWGIYTIAQDNNLIACLFYLSQGFVIGGLNTLGYKHTSQEHKADIYFYSDN